MGARRCRIMRIYVKSARSWLVARADPYHPGGGFRSRLWRSARAGLAVALGAAALMIGGAWLFAP